ncbi:Protein LEAD-SENSITIVE 1 [Cardamine amara subsp. amara]|uniref:Protein LEAD-SENSITIVE 1 n=1 Tax=Cardamine amara subsp. amara TaxID=228776 RepID=A0ABD1AVY4_CARAN
MGMISKFFYQKKIKIISREELKAGDHIFSWRKAKTYSHHGIYMGDDQVIHFTGQKPEIRNFWDKITSGSLMNHGGGKNHKLCPNCGDQSNLDGVVSSCLDCFLKGGDLYRFEYSACPVDFLYKSRRGTCTTAPSDPCDEVIYRAKFLLLHNGFGAYHAVENNCEDFAVYCKTSVLVGKKVWFGRTGQANLLSVSGLISQVIWPPLSDVISSIADMRLRFGAGKVSVESLVARSNEI